MGELTFGQKAVGLNFNPGQNPDVQEIKELYAKIIDKLDSMRDGFVEEGAERINVSGEKKRLLSVAITEAQGAQMWAVKGATWTD